MGDNDDSLEIDSSLQVNKQLATALNMEKLNHARTLEVLNAVRQVERKMFLENANLRNSLKIIGQNANTISACILTIFDEIRRTMNGLNTKNDSNQSLQVNNNVDILKDVAVTPKEKFSPIQTSRQQVIEKNKSDTEDVNNEPNRMDSGDEEDSSNKSNSEGDEEAHSSNKTDSEEDEKANEDAQVSNGYKKRKLDTLAEETENGYTTFFDKHNDQENNAPFSNSSRAMELINETQLSTSSTLIPKRIPLAENNSTLVSSDLPLIVDNNDQSKYSPNVNVSNVKRRTSRPRRNTKQPSFFTLARSSKRNTKELNSFVNNIQINNDSQLENSVIHQPEPDDVTFNTFKKMSSFTDNKTSTPYAQVPSASNNNGNFITTRKPTISDNNNSPLSTTLRRCSVALERMPATSRLTDSMHSLTTSKGLMGNEVDSSRPRSTRGVKKSYKEPLLNKKMRRN